MGANILIQFMEMTQANLVFPTIISSDHNALKYGEQREQYPNEKCDSSQKLSYLNQKIDIEKRF